jgi:hypothetical protein
LYIIIVVDSSPHCWNAVKLGFTNMHSPQLQQQEHSQPLQLGCRILAELSLQQIETEDTSTQNCISCVHVKSSDGLLHVLKFGRRISMIEAAYQHTQGRSQPKIR